MKIMKVLKGRQRIQYFIGMFDLKCKRIERKKYEACTNSHSIYVIKKGQKTRTEKSLILTGMAFENMN